MKSDKTFSGVTPDYGTIMRVNTRVTSETTAALMEQIAVYDSAYLGGHFRPVRRAVFIDRPLFGMSLMANNIPLLDIAWRTALESFKPYDNLAELDAVLEQLGGSSHAPAVTVIPCTTVLANGYKFADSLVQAQNAWFQDRVNWLVGNDARDNTMQPVTMVAGPGMPNMPALPVNAPYVAIPRLVVAGTPTMPRAEVQPYPDANVYLLPIIGQGPAPFLASSRRLRDSLRQENKTSRIGESRSYDMENLIPLRWAIFYQEQDVEIDSPVRKLTMISFLNHLFDYLDGKNLLPGQYQWPDANGAPSQPYSKTHINSTGHDLINEILAETARAAAIRLEYMSAEELPNSNEMQLIRAVANLLYFLDNRDLLLAALCNTSSIRQFITMLLESQLIHAGAQVRTVRPNAAGGFDFQATDFHAGVAPRESAEFFWDRVMTHLPKNIFMTAAVGAVGGFLTPSISPDYDRMIHHLVANAGYVDDSMDFAVRATAVGRTLIKSMNFDMRADYIAAAILNRLRESVPVIIALLKGEIEGFEHLHISAANAALSVEVTLNILESIQLMLERDLLTTKDTLAWEEPYSGAHFATAWQAFSVKFPTYPIEYVIHNLEMDYLRELDIAAMNDVDVGAGETVRTAVENAFNTVGLTLVQCEPAMTFLPLGRASTTPNGIYRTFMRGELQACGRASPYGDDFNELSGDVSVSHAALRVTSTYYVRSATIWNQMMEMPRQVVARSYNPQPTPVGWHDFFRMDITNGQLQQVLAHADPDFASVLVAAGGGMVGFTHLIDVNPAFRDVAVVLPYVQMMVQTPPEAYDFTMYSRVVFENDQKICNMAGTPVVLDHAVPLPGVEAWALPNLATQMAYHAAPVTHMILPLSWNAVR